MRRIEKLYAYAKNTENSIMKDSFYKKRDLKNLEHFQAPPLTIYQTKI